MRFGILLVVAGMAACASSPEQPEETMCTMEARSSFAVTVVDAVSGANLAPEATVRVTDGDFSATLETLGQSGVYGGGVYERAGTYTVIVSRPGYQQWQRAGVVVERDECHVITEQVEARLTRS